MEEGLHCARLLASVHKHRPSLRCLSLILALVALTAGPLIALTITVPVPEISAVFETTPQGERIVAPGWASTASPGDPELPFAEVRVVLPPNATPTSVSLIGVRTTLLEQRRDLRPAPPMATSVDGETTIDWGQGKQIRDGRNTLVYGKSALFPSAGVELAAVGDMRKWRIATVRYYPYRYNPVTRRLQLTSGGDISVSCHVPADRVQSIPGAADSVLADQVRALVANFDEAQDWYEGPGMVSGSVGAGSPGYLILTTSAIVSGSSRLQAFAEHKRSRGFDVTIATEAQWGGGTGDAAANKIRAYLKANYIGMGLKYVLLVGNPHPATGTVPMKMLWPRRNSGTYPEAPSDYFYADLTGNWDRDGDGYFGEGDNDFGFGGVDIYPEVIVGRIPFYGSYTELDSILQKVIDYEAGGIGGSWVRNVLVSMKPSDANTPGYHLGEAIKNDAADPAGFSTTRVYDQDYGLNPAPDKTPCTYDNVLSAWQGHAGFHFWWTHGSETLAADIMSSDRTQYLDDRYPSFVFQCSCLNAYPENAGNLAYSLLRRGAIATNAATRVSWYYQGQTEYANTDSNAGMTYRYALKIVRDHKPCGDAHFENMVEMPNNLWANHCVFNIYGDPSVAYAAGPVVTHTPLPDTDVTSGSYHVEATIASNGPLASGSPVIRWNTNGGSTFSTAPMSLQSGAVYSGGIPAQPLGATVHYYIHAADTQGRTGSSPTSAPASLHSFRVKVDTQPPTIQHSPLTNTGSTTGPYTVQATVTDDCGVSSVILRYALNGGAETALTMQRDASGDYVAAIPGPTSPNDRVSYYLLATDTSAAHKTARHPAAGYHTFTITRSRVVIHNSASVPGYFVGSNSNTHASVADALNTDPQQRFDISVVTDLSPVSLAGADALVLPDNAVFETDLASVSSWFTSGRTLVTLDSSANYAAYSGFLWPAASGTSGYGVYWDQYASVDDQKIVLQDPITSGYQVGQIIKSRGYGAQFFADQLPTDARVLSVSGNNPNRAYAVYRNVPGHGRLVALGPFRPLETAQYSMLREAIAARPAEDFLAVTASEAKLLPDGQPVRVEAKTVTSARAAASYVEEPDRSAGLRVSGASGLILGSRVTIQGTMSTLNGERVLAAQSVESLGSAVAVEPVAMATRALGGGQTGLQGTLSEYRPSSGSQLVPLSGASNVGLLVRLAGIVTSVASDHFYVDDGGGCKDASGAKGVRVVCWDSPKPAVGAFVVVTGVSSTHAVSGSVFRALVLPSSADVQVLR